VAAGEFKGKQRARITLDKAVNARDGQGEFEEKAGSNPSKYTKKEDGMAPNRGVAKNDWKTRAVVQNSRA